MTADARWDREAIAGLDALGARFVCWKWEERDGKPTKPPLKSSGKAYARVTDPATWCSLDAALAGAELPGINGIGFVLDAARDGIVGIDLDGCLSIETGKIEPWAVKIINDVRSYTEISPSGTGVKILVRADPVPAFAANKIVIHKTNGIAKDQAVEAFTKDRYFCLTGTILPGVPDEIIENTPAVERLAHWLAEQAGAKPAGDAGGLPQAFLDLLAQDAALAGAWANGTPLGGGTDTSASALDWRLALHLRAFLGDGEIATVLRHHRFGQIGGGKLRGAAAERRIEKILADLPIRQAQAGGSAGSAGSAGGAGGWPDPDLSLTQSHRRPAPVLDLSVFGPFWARWIGDAAEAKGAPPDFVAMPLIAAAGAMIANARRASPWPGWVEPPIIWQANVGLPSSGKSPALDAVTTDLLALLERDLDSDFDERHHDDLIQRARCKARRDVWEQAVKVAIKKGLPPPDPPREIEPPAAPTRRRLLTNNATIEQLSRLCAVNDRGLILCRDELAGWIGQMDKYGGNGADRATYIEAHGGRSCVIDRVKEGASIRVPYFSVSIIGCIQPDRLATMLLHGDDDGLTARLLLSWPEPRRPVRPKRHPDNVAALVALRWLLALAPDQIDDRKVPRVLPLTPQAADRLQEWRVAVADMETQAAGLFLSWLGKLPGMAVRIATCLEMLWWSALPMGTTEPAVISDGAVAAAVSLLSSYSIPMARRTFGEAALPQADRDAIALARWIAAQNPVPEIINARDLRHADAMPTREAGRYDAALNELAQAHWVMPAPRGSGPGRTRKDWLVNPKLKAAVHAA